MAYDSENYVVTDVPQPPTLSPEARETLTKARGLIEQGWCRNQLYIAGILEQPSQYCILGAIIESAGSENQRNTAKYIIRKWLENHRGHNDIAGFNDIQAADKADVLALFDAVLSEV